MASLGLAQLDLAGSTGLLANWSLIRLAARSPAVSHVRSSAHSSHCWPFGFPGSRSSILGGIPLSDSMQLLMLLRLNFFIQQQVETPANMLAPAVFTAVAVPTFKDTAILLIVIQLSLSTALLTIPHPLLPSSFVLLPAMEVAPRDGGDEVFIRRQQLFATGDTGASDKEYDDRRGNYRASNCCDSQHPYRYVTHQRNIRDKMRGRLECRASLPRHGVSCGETREEIDESALDLVGRERHGVRGHWCPRHT